MHQHVEARRQPAQKLRETDFGPDHARKFFAELGMNTQLCPRLKLLGFLTALLGWALVAVAEDQSGSKEKWSAPAAEARKKNPVAINESSLAAGEKIYLKRCLACHGHAEKGDVPD